MIAVCLINYNTRDYTAACLHTLLAQNQSCHIVVVDNASTDGSLPALTAQFATQCDTWQPTDDDFIAIYRNTQASIHFVAMPKNDGFASGNNFGIRFIKQQLHADAILFLNNDTEVPVDFVQQMGNAYRQLLQKYHRVALTTHEYDYYTHRKRHTGLQYLHLPTGLVLKQHLWPCLTYLCGACIMVDTHAPLWNDTYFLYYEDADYGKRLQNAGYHLCSTTATAYFHKQGHANASHRMTVFHSMWKFYDLNYPHYKKAVYLLRRLQYILKLNIKAYRQIKESYERIAD